MLVIGLFMLGSSKKFHSSICSCWRRSPDTVIAGLTLIMPGLRREPDGFVNWVPTSYPVHERGLTSQSIQVERNICKNVGSKHHTSIKGSSGKAISSLADHSFVSNMNDM
jgi:hypothetical protein